MHNISSINVSIDLDLGIEINISYLKVPNILVYIYRTIVFFDLFKFILIIEKN